jgi:endogenous inhibitor of DNA gyrase (YacG/DUF329 family)
MIFLLFGGGTRFKLLGDVQSRDCPRCHNNTTWTRLRRFHEFTLFFIPIARWGRQELEACPICGETVEVPRTSRAPHGWRRPRHAAA